MPALHLLASLVLLLLGAVFWRTQSSEESPRLDSQPGQGTLILGLEAPPAKAVDPVEKPQAEAISLDEPSPAQTSTSAPVPVPATAPVFEKAPLAYTVEDGDSLYRIVRKVYGTANDTLIQKIATANQLADAGSLAIGQKLSLPHLEGYPAPKRPE